MNAAAAQCIVSLDVCEKGREGRTTSGGISIACVPTSTMDLLAVTLGRGKIVSIELQSRFYEHTAAMNIQLTNKASGRAREDTDARLVSKFNFNPDFAEFNSRTLFAWLNGPRIGLRRSSEEEGSVICASGIRLARGVEDDRT